MLSIYTHLIEAGQVIADQDALIDDAAETMAEQDALIMEATELIVSHHAHRLEQEQEMARLQQHISRLQQELAQERTRSSLRGGIVRVQRTRLQELAAQVAALQAQQAGLMEVAHELARLQQSWYSVVDLSEERRARIVSLQDEVRKARQDARAHWAQQVEDLQSQLTAAHREIATLETSFATFWAQKVEDLQSQLAVARSEIATLEAALSQLAAQLNAQAKAHKEAPGTHKAKKAHKKRLPYGSLSKIAAATGYSYWTVKSVRYGYHDNARIQRLFDLAERDFPAFVAQLREEKAATDGFNNPTPDVVTH